MATSTLTARGEDHVPACEAVRGPVADDRLASGLGWISLGLGAVEVAAPNELARLIGIREQPLLVSALGMREIVGGIGILTRPRPAAWLWGRVAGDAMDLAVLTMMPRRSEPNAGAKVFGAMAAVAGVMALDLIASARFTQKALR